MLAKNTKILFVLLALLAVFLGCRDYNLSQDESKDSCRLDVDRKIDSAILFFVMMKRPNTMLTAAEEMERQKSIDALLPVTAAGLMLQYDACDKRENPNQRNFFQLGPQNP